MNQCNNVMSIFVSIQHTLLGEPFFTLQLDFEHFKNTLHKTMLTLRKKFLILVHIA